MTDLSTDLQITQINLTGINELVFPRTDHATLRVHMELVTSHIRVSVIKSYHLTEQLLLDQSLPILPYLGIGLGRAGAMLIYITCLSALACLSRVD